jgi:hypothetical protein
VDEFLTVAGVAEILKLNQPAIPNVRVRNDSSLRSG